MSLRFRRRIRILPGIYLNIGKTGVSTSIGPRGANINIGKRGTYLNTGIPGTGISYRQKISGSSKAKPEAPNLLNVNPLANIAKPPPLPRGIYSKTKTNTDSTSEIVTCEGLMGLSDQLICAREQRQAIAKEIETTAGRIEELKKKLSEKLNGFVSKILTSKEAVAKIQREIIKWSEDLSELNAHYLVSKAEIDFHLDPDMDDQFKKVYTGFQDMVTCDKIWDITSIRDVTNTKANKLKEKSLVERMPVSFGLKEIDFISSTYKPLHMQNSNGADLYLFPAFVLLINQSNNVLLVDLKEVKFTGGVQRFIECETSIPKDAALVDRVWTRSNKDGSPDMRFKDNIQRLVVNYFHLNFRSQSGLNETYYLSNVELAKNFANPFETYLKNFSNEDHHVDSQPSNDGAGSNNPVPSSPVTEEYFSILLEALLNLKKVTDTLEKDGAFLQSVKDVYIGECTDPKSLVSYFVLFDLIMIYKMLLGGDSDDKIIEMNGLGFVACEFIGDRKLLQSIDYPKFVSLQHRGIFLEVAKSIVKIKHSANPCKLNIKIGDQDSVSRNPDFAMPGFLARFENKNLDKYAVMLWRLATVIAKADGIISESEQKILHEIHMKLHNPIPELAEAPLKVAKAYEGESLNAVLAELDMLVGLEAVKLEVKTLINLVKMQKKRADLGLKNVQMSYHLVLTGSPGTGKTTVARIIAKIYSKIGILAKGQLVEVDKSGLIAIYLGQTPAKVNKAVDSALDGVLFIDEAYSLAEGCKEDYGKEAIATLVKRMEDDRGRLVVMVAGYTIEMKKFIDANSGLKSRFNKYIDFPDYTPDEMLEIFVRKCKELDYRLEPDARLKVVEVLRTAYEQRDRSFGNGRFVRNIFEKAIERQANRVAVISPLTREILTTIIVSDISNE